MVDWSKYYVDAQIEQEIETQPGELPSTQEEVTEPTPVPRENVNWNKYYVDEKPSTMKEIGRHVSRTSARVGETITGLPGDMVKFNKFLGDWLEEKVPVPKLLKGEQKESFVQRFGQKMLEKLPTSAELKQKSSELTEGFTDPQGALEEFGDDVIELASVLYGDKTKAPAKATKIVKNGLKAVGKAIAAKSAGKTAEKYGLGEKGQFITELGTLIIMSMVNQKMADRYVGDKFKKARTMLPKGLMADTREMTGELENLENELSKGATTKTKTEVKDFVSEVRGKVSGGAYPAEEVVDVMHDLNERMNSKKLFDELNKSEKKLLKFRYDKAKDVVGKEIGKIGKNNPEFLKLWSEGMEGHAAIQNSKKATRVIEKAVKKLPHSVATGIAAELLLFQNPEAAGALAVGFTAVKTGELMNRVWNSPTLRVHYMDVLNSAMAENSLATAKAITRLDEELKKEIEKDLQKTD